MHVTLVSGIDPSAPSAGGTRNYVLGLADRLQRAGIPVILVARGRAGPPFPGVTYRRIPSGPSSVRFLLRLAASAPGLDIPRNSIIHVQRPDDLMAVAYATRGNPKVCTLHGMPSRGVGRRKGAAYGALYQLLESGGLRRSDRVIAVNQETAQWYGDRYAWLRDRIVTVPVAVDTERFRPLDRQKARQTFGVSRDYAIAFAGRLTVEKRVEALVRSIPSGGNAELLVAGEGPEEKRIRKAAAGRPVRFLGPLPHERMPVLLNAADLLVLPSEYEGMPTVALEALACGTPVASTPVGALKDLVVPGQTGWIFETLDATWPTLVSALPVASLLRTGCVRAAQAYSWDRVFRRVLDVYHDAVGG